MHEFQYNFDFIFFYFAHQKFIHSTSRLFFRLFHFVFVFCELSPKTRVELGRRADRSVPNFLKLRWGPSKIKYSPSRLCVASTANGGGFRKGVVVEGDGVIIVDHGSRRKESNLMLSKTFFARFRVAFSVSVNLSCLSV